MVSTRIIGCTGGNDDRKIECGKNDKVPGVRVDTLCRSIKCHKEMLLRSGAGLSIRLGYCGTWQSLRVDDAGPLKLPDGCCRNRTCDLCMKAAETVEAHHPLPCISASGRFC
jgi:hypothetical protein